MDRRESNGEGGVISDVLILVPVGTSIATKTANMRNIDGKTVDVFREELNQSIRTRGGQYYSGALTEVGKRFSHRQERSEDTNPAEVSSLYAFAMQYSDPGSEKSICGKNVHTILIHSPEHGEACAENVKYILDKCYEEQQVPFTDTWEPCELRLLKDLQTFDAARYASAMSELAALINEYKGKYPDASIFLNATGGYKCLPPYLLMFALAMGDATVFYLFEDSPNVIELPTYAFGFDYAAWYEERSLLLPFMEEEHRQLISGKQRKALARALEKSRIGGLLTRNDEPRLNEVGRIVSARGLEQRTEKYMSDYGRGFLLLDRFQNEAYRDYLAERIRIWRYFATGDRIPETVEHGRGHVQRLLELARQLLIAMDELGIPPLTDEQLLVLIAGLWLHDIGHSGDYFDFEGSDGLVQCPENNKSTNRCHAYGDPNRVRDLHSVLSYQIIGDECDFLFPSDTRLFDKAEYDKVLFSIRCAALFHRQDMPTEKAGKVFKKNTAELYIAHGLEEEWFKSRTISKFPFVVALLRFIDGSENQAERAGDPNYYAVLSNTIKRHSKYLGDRLENDKSLNPHEREHMSVEKAFKEVQPGHYAKHRMLKSVFFVPADSPSEDDRPIIEGYGIADSGAAQILAEYEDETGRRKYSDGMDAIGRGIYDDWLEEHRLVQHLLPFKFRAFLAWDDNKIMERVPEPPKKTGKWEQRP